jgi:L-aminopeptidase/D-esterase-like protein
MAIILRNSGDIFRVLSTGNAILICSRGGKPKPYVPQPLRTEAVNGFSIDGLLAAAGEVVEEVIYNALCMAETMVGNEGQRTEELSLGEMLTSFDGLCNASLGDARCTRCASLSHVHTI